MRCNNIQQNTITSNLYQGKAMSLLSEGSLCPKKSRLIRMPDVISLTGLSRSSIYFKMKKKEFPPKIQIGERSIAWLEADIYEWINDKLTKGKNNDK